MLAHPEPNAPPAKKMAVNNLNTDYFQPSFGLSQTRIGESNFVDDYLARSWSMIISLKL